MMTRLCRSSEAAWAELDRMLESYAQHVKRKMPMTKDESLEVCGGPKGKHKKLLRKFLDEFEKREGTEWV